MTEHKARQFPKLKILFLSIGIFFTHGGHAVTSTELVPAASVKFADLLLKNGRIYTDHDTGRVWSQALSIRGGVILSIGTTKSLEKEIGPTTRVIDLHGKTVLPGFNETAVPLAAADLKTLQDEANKVGITSIQGFIRGEEEVKTLNELFTSKLLRLRYSLWGELEKPQEFLTLRERFRQMPEEWIRFQGVRGIVDGDVLSKSAALIQPYSDDPSTKGDPRYTQDRLNDVVFHANKLGLPVSLYACGDRSVSMAMTAFAHAKQQLFNSRLRNRIECAHVLPSQIYDWFRNYNIIATVQPSSLVFETDLQNYNDAKLGKERVRHTLPLKSLLMSRARVAFSSGWPKTPLNPMTGLYGAIHRQSFNGRPAFGWQPQQKLNFDQAIEAYTLEPAYATTEDHVKGSLREGKYADAVILDQDPTLAKATVLPKISVFMTIVGGQIVYDNSIPKLEPARN